MGSQAQVCPSSSGGRTVGSEAPEDHRLRGEAQLFRARIGTVCGGFASFPSWPECLLADSYLYKSVSSARNGSHLEVWGLPSGPGPINVTCEHSLTSPYALACMESIPGVIHMQPAWRHQPSAQALLLPVGPPGQPTGQHVKVQSEDQTCLCPTSSPEGWPQWEQPEAQD